MEDFDFNDTAPAPLMEQEFLMENLCVKKGRAPGGYEPPASRSAAKRWKSIHEQNMMTRLNEMHIIKKQNAQMSKEAAREIIRKIPVELLAKEWLSKEDATVDMRAYLVDHILPTLILGVERLLKEVDEKGLSATNRFEPEFNPVNFLAQYLMRNNPRFSNFAEASPYVRGLREVSDEIKQELFTFEDNRLARIKAETRRKRTDRETHEQQIREEKERRHNEITLQFKEWTRFTDKKTVELSFLQNTLRSFTQTVEQLPIELQEAAKFGHPLDPTDETGKNLSLTEFAEYISLFVEDLPFEVFHLFMNHMSKCSATQKASVDREKRRKILTNLFLICDYGELRFMIADRKLGLLDRARIMTLFEMYWDMLEAKDPHGTLRNPRRWPIVEVDEVDDILFDAWFEESDGGVADSEIEQQEKLLEAIHLATKAEIEASASRNKIAKERWKKEQLEQKSAGYRAKLYKYNATDFMNLVQYPLLDTMEAPIRYFDKTSGKLTKDHDLYVSTITKTARERSKKLIIDDLYQLTKSSDDVKLKSPKGSKGSVVSREPDLRTSNQSLTEVNVQEKKIAKNVSKNTNSNKQNCKLDDSEETSSEVSGNRNNNTQGSDKSSSEDSDGSPQSYPESDTSMALKQEKRLKRFVRFKCTCTSDESNEEPEVTHRPKLKFRKPLSPFSSEDEIIWQRSNPSLFPQHSVLKYRNSVASEGHIVHRMTNPTTLPPIRVHRKGDMKQRTWVAKDTGQMGEKGGATTLLEGALAGSERRNSKDVIEGIETARREEVKEKEETMSQDVKGGAETARSEDINGGEDAVRSIDINGGAETVRNEDIKGGAETVRSEDIKGGAETVRSEDIKGGAQTTRSEDIKGGAQTVRSEDIKGGAQIVRSEDIKGGTETGRSEDVNGGTETGRSEDMNGGTETGRSEDMNGGTQTGRNDNVASTAETVAANKDKTTEAKVCEAEKSETTANTDAAEQAETIGNANSSADSKTPAENLEHPSKGNENQNSSVANSVKDSLGSDESEHDGNMNKDNDNNAEISNLLSTDIERVVDDNVAIHEVDLVATENELAGEINKTVKDEFADEENKDMDIIKELQASQNKLLGSKAASTSGVTFHERIPLKKDQVSVQNIVPGFLEDININRNYEDININSCFRTRQINDASNYVDLLHLSEFSETFLNLNQFVQLIETFIGPHPNDKVFATLVHFLTNNYQDNETEKTDKLLQARQRAAVAKKKAMLNSLFEKWDNDASGFLELEDVSDGMCRFKDGQEADTIRLAQSDLRKLSNYNDNMLSRHGFRQFINLVIDELPGENTFNLFVEFLMNSVERSYADRIRGEARKKWIQQINIAATTSGISIEPVYKAVFQALYKDAETHGWEKRISASIAMLEVNKLEPSKGELLLRYAACTPEDCQYMLGKPLYKNMKGVSFQAVETGKPVHVPRVASHGNIFFWNYDRSPNDRRGSFIAVPLKDSTKHVFGVLGVDTMIDTEKETIFITHEIQFYQGVAKAFSIAYHYVEKWRKFLRVLENAISWFHRKCPHILEITVYFVEPSSRVIGDFVLRKMMIKDKNGSAVYVPEIVRLERKDNFFSKYLFDCIETSQTIIGTVNEARHTACPIRDNSGITVGIVDLDTGLLKILPRYESRETQRFLRLLQRAHKELINVPHGDRPLCVLEVEKDPSIRTDIMFERIMLQELRDNVTRLDPHNYIEMKGYYEPPRVITEIMRGTMAIFKIDQVGEGEYDNWETLKNCITSDLIQLIKTYDPIATANLANAEKLEKYLKAVSFAEILDEGSLAAQQFYNWIFTCLSLIEYMLRMKESGEDNPVVAAGIEKIR